MLGIVIRGQNCHRFVVLPLYCCHTSFSPEHEFSALHPIISLENIWKPLPASSNRTHGIETTFVQSFQELIRSDKIVERDMSMGVNVCVTQAQHHPLTKRKWRITLRVTSPWICIKLANKSSSGVSQAPNFVSTLDWFHRHELLHRWTALEWHHAPIDSMTLDGMYTSFRRLFRASITGRSL